MAPNNLDSLARIYGPATWAVYDQLDESLEPEGPSALLDMAADLVDPGSVLLDAGCRDGEHLVELVNRYGVVGIGVEPVPIHVARASERVSAAGLDSEITIHEVAIHNMDLPDDHVDMVWCRDSLVQIDDLTGALNALVRVAKPGAAMLVYTTVVTERLTAAEREMLQSHLGNVDQNLDRAFLETAFVKAGLTIDGVRSIGTEWREYAEERSQPTSRTLLRLARLQRSEQAVVAEHGQPIFDHVEANLHWEIFQFLGKLTSVVYVLRSPTT